MLKVNLKKYGKSAEMVERGEFAIQDSVTKQDIDLRADWELCFSPGQRVDMSMIFDLPHPTQRSDATEVYRLKCKYDCSSVVTKGRSRYRMVHVP